MQIPLVDLQAQYQTIKHEVLAAFEDVLENMQLFLGPQAQAFEHEFATYCGCRYGVGLSSGTDALALALRACDIGSGDEVITVANTFIATVEAIALVGATPVFVDVDPDTYALDWRQLDQVLTSRTRAILPVHLYGHPGPGLLAPLGQPHVQLGPQHRDGVDRVGQPGVLVVDGDRAVGVEEADVVAGDPPLDRRLGAEIGEDLLHAAGVQDAAGKVLRAGRLAALDQQHRASLPGELVGRHAARDAAADDDDLEVRLGRLRCLRHRRRHFSAAVIAGTSW